jgi:methyl-accepting chemotaxis protein
MMQNPFIGGGNTSDPIGSASVEIFADDKEYQEGLKKAHKSLNLFDKNTQKIAKRAGKAFIAGGVAITGALAGVVMQAAKAGDSLDKMSLRTGVTVENLSKLSFAAQISGSDINALETGFRFLARRMDETSQGVGIAKEAFEGLGISVEDSTGALRPSVDVMKEAAAAISQIDNQAKQTAVAMDIFGARSGPALLPLLKQGESGINSLMERAEELGLVMSTDAAKASAEFTDRMTEMTETLKMAAFQMGSSLLPVAQDLVNKFTDLASRFNNLDDSTKSFIAKSASIAAGFSLVAGPALLLIGYLPKLAAGFTTLGVALSSPVFAATGVLAALPLTIWAIKRAMDAFNEPVDRATHRLGKYAKFMEGVADGLKTIEKEQSRMIEQGWEPSKILIGDMNINLQELSGKLGMVLEPSRSVSQIMAILRKRLGDTNKATAETTIATDEGTKSTGQITQAMRTWGEIAKAVVSPLQAISEKLAEMRSGVGNLTELTNELKQSKILPQMQDLLDTSMEARTELAKPTYLSQWDVIPDAAKTKARIDAILDSMDMVDTEREDILDAWRRTDKPTSLLVDPKLVAKEKKSLEDVHDFWGDQQEKTKKNTKIFLDDSLQDWKKFTSGIKDDFRGLFDDMLDPSITNKWNRFFKNLAASARNYISDIFTAGLFGQFAPATPYGYAPGGQRFASGMPAMAGRAGFQAPIQRPYSPVGAEGPMPKPGADPVAAFLASLEFAGFAQKAFFGKTPKTLTGSGYMDQKLNAALQAQAYKQGGMLYPGQGQHIADIVMQQTAEAEKIWLANQPQLRQARPQGAGYGYRVDNPNLAPAAPSNDTYNMTIVLPDIKHTTPSEIEDMVSRQIMPAIRSSVKRGKLNRSVLRG